MLRVYPPDCPKLKDFEDFGSALAEENFRSQKLSERSKINCFSLLKLVSWLVIDMEGGEYDGNMSVEEVTDDEAPKKPPPGWQKQNRKPPPVLSSPAVQNV